MIIKYVNAHPFLLEGFEESLLSLAPFFWAQTHQIARNHIVNGLRVPSNIVPAVTLGREMPAAAGLTAASAVSAAHRMLHKTPAANM